MLCQTGKDGGCHSVLLNSKPVYTADIIDSIRKTEADCIRLIFTVEEPHKCVEIISEYKDALNGKNLISPEMNTFTRGHLKRGVI